MGCPLGKDHRRSQKERWRSRKETFGIAVFDHSANPNHPSAWRADEQKLINPNASGLGDWLIPAKQERVFRYRLVVYRGSATREQLAARFAIFADDSRRAAPARSLKP